MPMPEDILLAYLTFIGVNMPYLTDAQVYLVALVPGLVLYLLIVAYKFGQLSR